MESWDVQKTQYYEAIRSKHASDEQILKSFSTEEKQEIIQKQELLSVLANFIGRDFSMPVFLNEPGKGWHWNFQENIVKVDPTDLLEKPMDYLRFVICHEGGHRRISRTEFIPEETWKQTGFPFLMNAIEDPRMNNFVADSYSAFERYMEFAYEHDFSLGEELKEKTKGKIGHTPKHIQAGLEYMRLWFYDRKGEPYVIREDLPSDVQEVVRATLASAKDSWWTYPSKEQADSGEHEITRFAEASYHLNLERIWPQFKTLIEQDQKTQELEELLNDIKDGRNERGDNGIPQELEDLLSEDEKKALEDTKSNATEEEKTHSEMKDKSEEEGGGESIPVDLDSLPESLKQKLKKYIDTLPPEVKRALQVKAEKVLKEASDEMAQSMQGKFERAEQEAKEVQDGNESYDAPPIDSVEKENQSSATQQASKEELEKAVEDFQRSARKVFEKDRSPYEKVLSEVLPIVMQLENELRQVFVARRSSHWETGYSFGKKIDIKKRIQEKAKGVSVFESKAWQKRELPQEKDYAVTLLVDLSGSMRGEKINETFKSVVVLTEVLNRLSIKTEILGFNEQMHEYQRFGEKMSNNIRAKIGAMSNEVHSPRSKYNDDGWALTQASLRLDTLKNVDHKILVTLSDGIPVESHSHSGEEFDLHKVIERISAKHTQRLIGLGIGSGTAHVQAFYPESIANVNVKEMAERLAKLLKDVIVNPRKV